MKPRFNVEEHAEMGAMLAAISDELTRRYVRTANAYPHTMRAVGSLKAAVDALSRARSELDGAMSNEHPDAFKTTVYYPHTEDRQRLTLSSENTEPPTA